MYWVIPKSELKRFWLRVVKSKDGCWIYKTKTGYAGYAAFFVRGRAAGDEQRSYMVHRLSWELHKGPIPDGMVVCHKCDVKLCVRPDHLFIGSAKQNSRDMVQKGRCRLIGQERADPSIILAFSPEDLDEVRCAAVAVGRDPHTWAADIVLAAAEATLNQIPGKRHTSLSGSAVEFSRLIGAHLQLVANGGSPATRELRASEFRFLLGSTSLEHES